MNQADGIALGGAALVGLMAWLALQVWKSKPSWEQVATYVRNAINEFHTADIAADELRLGSVTQAINSLREVGEIRHQQNTSRLDRMESSVERMDTKLDAILERVAGRTHP